jgi:L-fuculose-phosphate aldolase
VRKGEVKTIELTGQNVLAMRDAQAAQAAGATHVQVSKRCVITPSARDFLRQNGIELVIGGAAASGSAVVAAPSSSAASPVQATRSPANPRLFSTREAEAIKLEICAVGRKLWNRAYVDGNGGNISYRIGPNEVLCTPTLFSKLDLTPADLCLVDLDGVQIAGTKPRTSEIFLHLEIYKAVPEAKAAVHCHPPHATAYAITGRVPPNGIIPEFEVMIGKVAISPYETPGTAAFAQTVLPYVREHPDAGVAVGRSHLADLREANHRPAGHQEEARPAGLPLRPFDVEGVPALRSRGAELYCAASLQERRRHEHHCRRSGDGTPGEDRHRCSDERDGRIVIAS